MTILGLGYSDPPSLLILLSLLFLPLNPALTQDSFSSVPPSKSSSHLRPFLVQMFSILPPLLLLLFLLSLLLPSLLSVSFPHSFAYSYVHSCWHLHPPFTPLPTARLTYSADPVSFRWIASA